MNVHLLNSPAIIAFFFLLIGMSLGYFFARRKISKKQLEEHTKINVEREILEEKLKFIEDRNSKHLEMLATNKKELTKEFENLANKIFESKEEKFKFQSKEAIDSSLSPLRRDINDFKKQVESAYDKESKERNILVGQISELQKQTMKVSADAVSLANALRGDNKTQGNWGEFVLERLLEDAGLTKGREYQVQTSFKNEEDKRRNPDVVVHLPEGRDIIIDSKVSLVAYEKYFHEEDPNKKDKNLAEHITSLKTHIKQLSVKSYEDLQGIKTLDFVIIFIPIEAAFMLALDKFPELMKDAYDKGIILVSPSTLLATLRTIKNLWRYEDQNKNSQLIAEKAGGLYDQFVLYVESMEEIGKNISKSYESWNTANKRLSSGKGNLIRRSEEIKRLGAKTKKHLPENLKRDTAKLDIHEN